MAFPWTQDIEQAVIRLRDEQHWPWEDVARHFGMASEAVPRTRYSRLKRGVASGGRVPRPAAPPPPATPASAPVSPPYEVQARFLQSEYDFDGTTYYFPVNKNVVKVPAETWERIVAEYSGEGANEVQARIAMSIGMHKKVLEACLRAYGHFKARPPVTREELADAEQAGDHTPLYARAIEVAEAKFERGLTAYKLRALEQRNRVLARQLHDRTTLSRELTQAIETAVTRYAPPVVTKVAVGARAADDVYDLHVPLFDMHFGMVVHGLVQWGKDFDTDLAAAYVRAVAYDVAQYVRRAPGTCRRIYLRNGGDCFHAFERRTRRGTPLEREKPDQLVFEAAFDAFVGAIDLLRPVCAVVDYDGVPGNHDGIHEWMLRKAIAVYYRTCPDVVVHTHATKRTHFLVGTSLHVFDHGEEFTRFDPSRMAKAELIARLTGQPFRQAEKIYLYVGHTHHRETKTHGAHLELIRVPTFAHTNDHEEALAFYGEPEASFYRLDPRGRIASEQRLYLSALADTLAAVAA